MAVERQTTSHITQENVDHYSCISLVAHSVHWPWSRNSFLLFLPSSKRQYMQPGLVLDADALYMLSLDDYRDIFEQLLSYENDVITPNSLKSKRPKEALYIIRNNENFLDDEKWFNAGILVQKESGDVDVKIYYIEVERIGRYQ